ncbi:GNAT family N-acetyltransferase [Salinibacterium sp. G-O1]|uniref:GNAT family N-acetyltransferase n=1 Tax=Salinibacterium sp. G-O1 TaxID=3046208 RepID=UPI0024BA6327|nr:GNAT family N-acetyltransferase [Salinibacterium sp. G-O1]MDJ0336062.1 GNAT family N-acetyltransferase [Salinibacterium sp. G-O1]
MSECSVVSRSWSELTTSELYDVLKLRTDVFFVEQKVDEEELDNRDQEPGTRHYWIADSSGTAAYLRVLVNEQPEHLDARHIIGRVVVRTDRRGEGLAQKLMDQVLKDFAGTPTMLHAQQYVAPLYAKFGFVAFGEPYEEATIMHISMYRAGTN